MKIEELQVEREKVFNELSGEDCEINRLISESEDVRKYLYLSQNIEKLKERLETLDEDIQLSQMEKCVHLFICTSPASELGNNPVYCCLRCGLTNLYQERLMDEPVTPFQERMNLIYRRNSMQGLKLKINSNDVDFYQQRLAEITLIEPYATDIKLGLRLEQTYRSRQTEDKPYTLAH